MIIPIRCFTCGKPIADKWDMFMDIVREEKSKDSNINNNESNIKYIDLNNTSKSIEGNALDKLGLDRYCCRRMILTNTDLISII